MFLTLKNQSWVHDDFNSNFNKKQTMTNYLIWSRLSSVAGFNASTAWSKLTFTTNSIVNQDINIKLMEDLKLPTAPTYVFNYETAILLETKALLKGFSGIYGWYSTISGKVYIGSAKLLHKRPFAHLNSVLASNAPLKAAFKKYGFNAFLLVIFEVTCTSDLATKTLLETRENIYLNCTPTTLKYNLQPLAYSSLGYIHLQATKDKIGAANRGNPSHTEGKCLSEATKANISAARLGNLLPRKPVHLVNTLTGDTLYFPNVGKAISHLKALGYSGIPNTSFYRGLKRGECPGTMTVYGHWKVALVKPSDPAVGD